MDSTNAYVVDQVIFLPCLHTYELLEIYTTLSVEARLL